MPLENREKVKDRSALSCRNNIDTYHMVISRSMSDYTGKQPKGKTLGSRVQSKKDLPLLILAFGTQAWV